MRVLINNKGRLMLGQIANKLMMVNV